MISFTYGGWFKRFHGNCICITPHLAGLNLLTTLQVWSRLKRALDSNQFQSRDLENHWQPDTLLHMLYKVTVCNMSWQISYTITNN